MLIPDSKKGKGKVLMKFAHKASANKIKILVSLI